MIVDLYFFNKNLKKKRAIRNLFNFMIKSVGYRSPAEGKEYYPEKTYSRHYARFLKKLKKIAPEASIDQHFFKRIIFGDNHCPRGTCPKKDYAHIDLYYKDDRDPIERVKLLIEFLVMLDASLEILVLVQKVVYKEEEETWFKKTKNNDLEIRHLNDTKTILYAKNTYSWLGKDLSLSVDTIFQSSLYSGLRFKS